MRGNKLNGPLHGIEVFHTKGGEEIAEQVGYGIEEEGLPYMLSVAVSDCFEEAYTSSKKLGLGVAIGADESRGIKLFSRQLKENTALLSVEKNENSVSLRARTIGKNAARVIKKRPFIFTEED